jgi:hypothetical protein
LCVCRSVVGRPAARPRGRLGACRPLASRLVRLLRASGRARVVRWAGALRRFCLRACRPLTGRLARGSGWLRLCVVRWRADSLGSPVALKSCVSSVGGSIRVAAGCGWLATCRPVGGRLAGGSAAGWARVVHRPADWRGCCLRLVGRWLVAVRVWLRVSSVGGSARRLFCWCACRLLAGRLARLLPAAGRACVVRWEVDSPGGCSGGCACRPLAGRLGRCGLRLLCRPLIDRVARWMAIGGRACRPSGGQVTPRSGSAAWGWRVLSGERPTHRRAVLVADLGSSVVCRSSVG